MLELDWVNWWWFQLCGGVHVSLCKPCNELLIQGSASVIWDVLQNFSKIRVAAFLESQNSLFKSLKNKQKISFPSLPLLYAAQKHVVNVVAHSWSFYTKTDPFHRILQILSTYCTSVQPSNWHPWRVVQTEGTTHAQQLHRDEKRSQNFLWLSRDSLCARAK